MEKARGQWMNRTGLLAALLSGLMFLLTLHPSAQAQSILEGRDLSIGTRSYHYPEALGEVLGPVTVDDVTWLGVGPVVYGFNDSGQILRRLDFSGPVRSLDGSQGLLTVTTGAAGAQDTYTVQGGEIRERVVFVPDVNVTQWLEKSARLASPAAVSMAATTDPTNPFLALRHAELARGRGDLLTARSEVQRAVSLETPFPATLKLAAALEAQGVSSAVNLLLARAQRDYLSRGYDPAMPVSAAAMLTYGNPQGEVQQLLKAQQLDRAGVWLQYLLRVSPRAEGMQDLYARYVQALEAQGRDSEAQQWRDFAQGLHTGTLYNLGPQSLFTVAALCRLLALVLALSSLCALLYLHARYRHSEQGQSPLGQLSLGWHPLARVRRSALGYARRGEKLMVFSLLCALLLSLLAWNWAARTQNALASGALNIGTYGGGWFYEQLSDLSPLSNRDTALLRGLSAQLDGDEAQARQFYQTGLALSSARSQPESQPTNSQPSALGHSFTTACIQNNLGVLYQQQGNPANAQSLWREALSSDPTQASATYNLGRSAGTALCYPNQTSTISAFGGNVLDELPRLFNQPWQTLQQTPTGLPSTLQKLWAALLLSLTAYSFMMLFARPLQATRPQTHWLAWLLPGAAFLRSSWGVVPLLLWAFCVVEGWLGAAPTALPPTLPTALSNLSTPWLWGLLLGTYTLNTLLLALTANTRQKGKQ